MLVFFFLTLAAAACPPGRPDSWASDFRCAEAVFSEEWYRRHPQPSAPPDPAALQARAARLREIEASLDAIRRELAEVERELADGLREDFADPRPELAAQRSRLETERELLSKPPVAAPLPAARAADLTALAALYATVEEGMDLAHGHLSSQQLCSVLLHRTVVELWQGQPPTSLDRAVATFGETCSAAALPLRADSTFASSWDAGLRRVAARGPTRLILEPARGDYAVDGVVLDGAQRHQLPLLAGEHRIDYITPGGQVQSRTVHAVPGEQLSASDDEGLQVLSVVAGEALITPPPSTPAVVVEQREGTPVLVQPRLATLPLAVGLGVLYAHDNLFAVVDTGLHLQLLPWFSARAGMALQLATQPVYLSRWESTPLLLRLEGGLRADPLFSKTFRPFLELGAMGELQVGAGAYARLGLDLPLGQGRLELSAAMPVHFADTLGFVGAELRLGSRFGRLP